MNDLLQPLREGGPVIIAILGLSVILYSRCFSLLWSLRSNRRNNPGDAPASGVSVFRLRLQQDDLQQGFRRQRLMLGAMVAAAPLLGLLGTVTGMIGTFHNLAARAGQQSMEGLAAGISEALLATEAGLAVAIPAILVIHVAHRQMQKRLEELLEMERRVLEAG